ncbi:ATP-binding protein [soil metagenome]
MPDIPDILYRLAPDLLPCHRSIRFDGGGYEVPLSRFAPVDRDILERLYRAVQGLPLLRRATRDTPDYLALEGYIRRVGDGALMADVHRLGEATRRDEPDYPAARKATHDIRGGGLCILLGTAEMLDIVPDKQVLIRKCVEAARDHAKIMRNLLPDIDPETRLVDEAAKAHGIDHFTTKWAGMTARGPNGPVRVAVHCDFIGAISARCLETSSIDRVVYNYVNNAVRFAADEAVTVWVFPVGGGLTRWVVQNAIAPDQVAFLADRAGPNLAHLFAGGVTRGGTGIGLANCAEIVADCYGLESPAFAVQQGYLGAAVHDSSYYSWFHWPTFVLAENGHR